VIKEMFLAETFPSIQPSLAVCHLIRFHVSSFYWIVSHEIPTSVNVIAAV